jgi:hypothetical protein
MHFPYAVACAEHVVVECNANCLRGLLVACMLVVCMMDEIRVGHCIVQSQIIM